ncbi:MAG: hypothetical protein WC530_11210 [Candidatus Omnitrophota bacterium]
MATQPTTATGIDWEAFKKQFEQMKTMTAPTSGSAPDSVSTPMSYDLAGLQTQIKTTQDSLTQAEGALKGLRANRYNEEYSAKGLDTIKNKIGTLDTKIANEKSVRDTSISKTRKNPYYSAANITGESAEIEKAANANINNMIEERNAVAGDYNSAIDEITKKIALETADKEEDVENAKYNLNYLTNQLSTYQQMRSQELSQKESKQEWEMDFALKLEDAERVAKEAAKPKTTISEYEAGGYRYRDTINSETGEVIKRDKLGAATKSSTSSSEGERFSARVAGGEEPDPGLKATAQRLINQGVSDPTRMGYTGDLATRLEAEMDWINGQTKTAGSEKKQTSAPAGTTTEEAFRREVRNAWKENYTPDQLKQAYANISFTNSKKSIDEIIDDEWNVKNETGIKGWWDRLWRAGV